MKYLIIAALALGLTSCSGGKPAKRPGNLDNACAMKNQRGEWFSEMNRAQRKWGVPVASMMATIYQESKFDGTARTPVKYAAGVVPLGRQSSAYGFAQAIDSTWEWYQKAEGKKRAKRDDFGDAVDCMGWYMNQSKKRNGIALNDPYNQYLAYHDGHSGYAKGSYRKKGWLIPVARSVEDRAILYQTQLRRCR